MQCLLLCWFYCLVKCFLMCVFVSRFWQYSEIESKTAFNQLQEQEIELIICKKTHTQMFIVFLWLWFYGIKWITVFTRGTPSLVSLQLRSHIMKNMFSLVSTYIRWSSQNDENQWLLHLCSPTGNTELNRLFRICSCCHVTTGVIIIGRPPLSGDGKLAN